MIKGCKEKFFINQISDENIRRLHQGKKFLGQKECFLIEKKFSLMKTSDIFVGNLVNKKLLLAAFYHSTYQHDSKDFNICNYNLNFLPCYLQLKDLTYFKNFSQILSVNASEDSFSEAKTLLKKIFNLRGKWWQ